MRAWNIRQPNLAVFQFAPGDMRAGNIRQPNLVIFQFVPGDMRAGTCFIHQCGH